MISSETDAVRVLHGFAARDGSLVLWAETDSPARAPAAAELTVTDALPVGPGSVANSEPSRRGRRESVPEHGFALSAGLLPPGERRARATLLLPSTSTGPLPSPQLGLPSRRGRPRLRPWAVPAVTVPFVDDDLADTFGARAAPSLEWLAELSAFAADLVNRGRVLPGLVFDGAQPRARWRPVLGGPDAAGHADLLRRMPAAARAERARPGDVAGLPAADTLHAALGRLVDSLVRERLAAGSGPPLPAPGGAGPSRVRDDARPSSVRDDARPSSVGGGAGLSSVGEDARSSSVGGGAGLSSVGGGAGSSSAVGRAAGSSVGGAGLSPVLGEAESAVPGGGGSSSEDGGAVSSSASARAGSAAVLDGAGPSTAPRRAAAASLSGGAVSAIGGSPADALDSAGASARRFLVGARSVGESPGRTQAERTLAAWLGALAGEPEFDGPADELQALADALDGWHAEAVKGAAVRVCFRLSYLPELELDEPDATGEPVADGRSDEAWLLEFLLQPLDEPSVLVPAADVWRDRAAPLRRWTHHPQERLLAGLGRAARLYPELDVALRMARPADLLLDTAGAYRFLKQAAVLEQAGYGIMVPAWWREPQSLGLALDVRARDAVTPVLRDEAANLASIVDYQWGLALGGRVLTEDELADLARVQVPLVRLRGRWVYLDAERLRSGLDFLRRGGGTMTAGDALRMVRLLPPEELPLPVTATGGKGWLADLLSGELDERLELVESPPGLVGTLRPYQKRGLSWLVFLDRLGLGACLADDMGLGKTVQLLALELRERRGPTLLICPLSVLGNWQREAARFAPGLTVRVLHGADRPDPAHLVDGCDVLLTTYATATRDADALAAVQWDRVVLDEAQHIKNSASSVAKAVRRFPARHRVALTGTPVENRLAELWSILDFLNPGVLGSAHTFRARYAVPIERYAEEDAATRLRQATRPFLLRRVKADPAVISDLPDKRYVRHLCGLTTEQATLYRAVLDDMLLRLKEGRDKRRKGIVLAAMTKLKQVCNHPAHLLGDGSPLPGRSGKLERLEEILDSVLADGERALCFTQFTRFGSLLVPHLAARFNVPVRYLHGGTSRGERDALVAAFQADERPGIFVLSLKAGGTGLNLTAANHVVHVDRWWNPATEAQATDRAFRIGQDRDVQVHTLVCLGTLEERIDRLIADKGVLAERVVGTGEGWLTTLTTNELRDLLALAPEAVGD